MAYLCPRGCERNGKPIPIETVRGWKKHMTRTHGGYGDEELAIIVGATPIDASKGRDLFLNEIDGPSPEGVSESGTGADGTEGGERKPASPTPSVTIKESKKFKAEVNKLKAKLAASIPEALNSSLKQKGPEWE